ncbi:MAG: enoyl-CoA hydratase/isomerase family protein [Hyphomonadaceae bacterium]|nr:enoyl-CoA hydratase/isomerase family protein [Hyphomonadaceae bacterium]
MTDQIQSEVQGKLGIITLNRPGVLNALTTEMCVEITRLMCGWVNDENIGAVLVRGGGERAFCAGGDVVMLHDSGKDDGIDAEKFWRTEYALNELIQRYDKPYIALIDGVVMGGGVGLSVHGRYRVAGDNTLFAMPETGIGYFPDVGGTYFLPRLSVPTGMWLGLTGARLGTAQVCALGIATHFVASSHHNSLVKTLGRAELDGTDGPVMEILEKYGKAPLKVGDSPDAINAFFGASMGEIIETLTKSDSEWAKAQIDILSRKSPLALAVTFEALTRGAGLTFREAMARELDISLNFLKTQDFYEGIRAQLIDRDRNPKWSHESVGEVTNAQVEHMFERAAEPELEFLDQEIPGLQ